MNAGRLLFGFGLIVLGLLFLLDQADVLDAGDTIGDWWPLILVAIGVIQLLSAPRAYLGPLIVIGIGLVLLSASLDVIPADAGELFWPLVLIAVGAWFILNRSIRERFTGRASSADDVNAFALFSGNDVVNRSGQFQGGTLTAVMGGITLDLREAQLAPGEVVVDATAIFGGVDVLVPRTWNVTAGGLPIFGGFENKTNPLPEVLPDARLNVRGMALFGGVTVKHER